MFQSASDSAPRRLLTMLAHLAPEGDRLTAAYTAMGLAFYYLVPVPLLALPGLLLFALGAWRRLSLVLCMLPLTFPFWFVPKRVAGHLVFPLSEIALAVCAAVALVDVLRRLHRQGGTVWWRRVRLKRRARALAARLGNWTVLGASLLLLGTLVGVGLARNYPAALRTERWDILEPLLYLVLVAVYVRGERQACWLLWALLGSAALLAALALLQIAALHVTFTPLAEGNRLAPLTSVTGNPPRATALYLSSSNALGTWMERALPLALALGSVPGRMAPRERMLAWACGLLYLLALYWSGSRGAWIAVCVAAFVVLAVNLRRHLRALALVAIAVTLALVWQRDWLARDLLTAHGSSNTIRLLVWRAALGMLHDHPLLGIGPDQFLYYYSNRYTDRPYWIAREHGRLTPAAHAPDIAQPHNLPLDLWLSGGLIGLAGFAIVLADIARRSLCIWRDLQGRGWRAGVALGIGTSVLAGLVHGMVDSAYFFPDLALAFWWTIALLVVLERASHSHRSVSTRERSHLPTSPLR